MQKLGTVPIPNNKYQRNNKENRAHLARKILSELTPGKADLFEFDDKKDAQNMRSMISTMAILTWGEGGHVATSNVENMLYVWLQNTGGKEE